MPRIEFDAPEYQSDGAFQTAHYAFDGDESSGWRVLRNDAEFLRLGPGYTPVESLYCGVCSTDLARRYLPYPLPQVIGHEVVGRKNGRPVVVEINASHLARGLASESAACPYCADGSMNTQCPHRITLGIDRLPGGFAPYFLAPVHAILPVPEGVDPLTAALTEPFAAALQGVEATHPRNGERAAVLGPRRLGALILAALAGFRKRQGLDFSISALARHDQLLDLAGKLGADEAVDLRERPASELQQKFDVVFDTTGSPEGFEAALGMARRVLHLKSTNGRPVLGLVHMTDLVVEEIALAPALKPGEDDTALAARLEYSWPAEREAGRQRRNSNIYIAPDVSDELFERLQRAAGPERRLHRLDPEEARAKIQAGERNFPEGSPFPRFDLAIASSLAGADRIIRPVPGEEFSLLRARGAILLAPGANDGFDSPLHEAVAGRGLEIHSSRCGNFERALAILKDNPEIAAAIRDSMITQRYSLEEIDEAFEVAADSSRSIKVVVETNPASS